MAEAGKFHITLSEWTTPERLFVRLMSIFGAEDLAHKELANAYYTDVRSARVPRSPWGLHWEEAQINAPEFCAAHPLIMWPGELSIENEIPQRRRWMLFFSLADAYARWPSLRDGASNEVDARKERDGWRPLGKEREREAQGFLNTLAPCNESSARRAAENHFKAKIPRDQFRKRFTWPKRSSGRPSRR
jgi:hypothetical protein